jgi:nitrite reductase/ring-hydroxylating ferredoxin subunit
MPGSSVGMSTIEARTPRGYDAAEQLAKVEALDAPADAIAKKIRGLVPAGPVKDALSGSWLGHALHPVLTDVPIGTWTSAVLLDWLGGDGSRDGADRLIALGLAAAAPTFASGWLEYADSTVGNETVKRVGIVHAASNGTAAVLFATSLAARRNGARGRGKLLALAGGAFMLAGGFLGGHLSFAEGTGVNRNTFEAPPEDWTDVAAESELPDGELRCFEVEDVDVLVVRHGGELFALSNTCSHRGGSLHEGEIVEGCVQCPLHSSRFRLRDGSVIQGPAAYPQPVWETRVRAGRVEVRPALGG